MTTGESCVCILIPLPARRRQEENSLVFPFDELLQLERRVGKDQWSIPYKREESLGRCLLAATRLAKEGELHDRQELWRRGHLVWFGKTLHAGLGRSSLMASGTVCRDIFYLG